MKASKPSTCDRRCLGPKKVEQWTSQSQPLSATPLFPHVPQVFLFSLQPHNSFLFPQRSCLRSWNSGNHRSEAWGQWHLDGHWFCGLTTPPQHPQRSWSMALRDFNSGWQVLDRRPCMRQIHPCSRLYFQVHLFSFHHTCEKYKRYRWNYIHKIPLSSCWLAMEVTRMAPFWWVIVIKAGRFQRRRWSSIWLVQKEGSYW